MDIILVQIVLGIALFFIINWIGKHSISVGYVEISLFIKDEDSPAVNFLIRVLTPLAYLLSTSALLYILSLDKYVINFYLVNIYYILFRLVVNLLTQRGSLLNWSKQVIYWVTIISLSYLLYIKIIKFRHNLLPDFTTLANEIWIIMIVFVFQLLNKLEFPKTGAIKRRESYLRNKYIQFKFKYQSVIHRNTKSEVLERVSYAILIYEDFNRPSIIRMFEYLTFFITRKEHSLGVMQYSTSVYINNKQSVDLGTRKIRSAYDNIIAGNELASVYSENSFLTLIINKYNSGSKYEEEVIKLSDSLKELFYLGSIETIYPLNEPT